MASPQLWLGKKVARSTVRHVAHGTASKVTRTPVRSTSLLTAGALVGAALGFLLGRRTAKPATGPDPIAAQPAPQTPATSVHDPAAAMNTP